MAKPDDGRVCQPMFGGDGELIAVVHGSPDMSAEARKALAEVVAAARRMFAERDAASGGEMSRRQEAAFRRIRERNARLRGEQP